MLFSVCNFSRTSCIQHKKCNYLYWAQLPPSVCINIIVYANLHTYSVYKFYFKQQAAIQSDSATDAGQSRAH